MVDEISIDGDFVVDTNVTIALSFDLRAGLRGNAHGGYTFEPLVDASLVGAS